MPRLDRYLASLLKISRKEVQQMLAQRRVEVDGAQASDMSQVITGFSRVVCDGQTLQAKARRYLMLNKPAGVVSATTDNKHRTVIDLLRQPYRHQLHIVGRLDFNSTGLVLLTNDGQWSRQLSLPGSRLMKRYRVTVEKALTQDYVAAFEQGMHFSYEDITTRPAMLTILSKFEAEVGLIEGRYHQIKRMFGYFDNKVLRIHRFAVGGLVLDEGLASGHSRELTLRDLEALPRQPVP